MPDTDAPDRDALVRVMADALWCGERRREITEYWRNTGGYQGCVLRVRAQLAALEAAGCVVMPAEATEEMHHAARDWSYAKYGKPIGFDASKGCWDAMVANSPFRSKP